jgi:hypothetical protein
VGISETRSPHNSSRGDNNPRRGYSPGSRSSPSRAPDNVPPPPARVGAEPVPALGTGGTAELERAMDKGMRNDRR